MADTSLKIQMSGTEELIKEMRYVRSDLRRFCEALNEWSSTFCTAVATFEKAYEDNGSLPDAPAPIVAPAAPVAPQPTPAPISAPPMTAVPVQPTNATPAAPAPAPQVPTSQISYDLNQLTEAASKLMDTGGEAVRAQLQKIVADLGCKGLYELPKEKFGEFAARLRAIGGQI